VQTEPGLLNPGSLKVYAVPELKIWPGLELD
jgi:hypothetical protein